MTYPSPNAWYNETYSTFSFYQHKIILGAYYILFLGQTLHVVYLSLGNYYVDFFFSEAQMKCRPYRWFEQTPIQYLRNVIYSTINSLFLFCILLQIFEWVAVIYIIQTQLGKSLGSIINEH